MKLDALSHALQFHAQIGDKPSAAGVVTTAGVFEQYLAGTAPAAPVGTPPKPPTKKAEAPKPETPAAPPAGAQLEYERDVKAPMMALAAAKGRDAVTPIFAEFKVKNAKELKPEQWPAFIAAVAKAAA